MNKLNKADQNAFDNLPTKSAKIRFLNTKEYTRSEIAATLKIRYQHVRNVLITPIMNERK